jgi:hypothetical protein
MFVVCVVCWQVGVFATRWSQVQRSPIDCGAWLCMIRKPRERGDHSPRWAAEPEITNNNKLRKLRLDWREPVSWWHCETFWLWGQSAHCYSTCIIRCTALRFRTTSIVQRSNLLYTLFDMFHEKSQRSATEDDTVKCFVFGTRMGQIMRMRVLPLFGFRWQDCSRALPWRFPRGRHRLISTRNSSCSLPDML